MPTGPPGCCGLSLPRSPRGPTLLCGLGPMCNTLPPHAAASLLMARHLMLGSSSVSKPDCKRAQGSQHLGPLAQGEVTR